MAKIENDLNSLLISGRITSELKETVDELSFTIVSTRSTNKWDNSKGCMVVTVESEIKVNIIIEAKYPKLSAWVLSRCQTGDKVRIVGRVGVNAGGLVVHPEHITK